MDFYTFFIKGLKPTQREAFAEKVGSTPAYLGQVARGHKSIELGLADAIVGVSNQFVELDDLPLTENARHQRRVRGKPVAVERRAGGDRRSMSRPATSKA